MLHASADAMAEILGIAPTPSPSVSGYSTPTSLPATTATPALPIASASLRNTTQDKPIEKSEEDAEKLRRKAEKKATKALKASGSAAEASASDIDAGKELQKKKRKRDA